MEHLFFNPSEEELDVESNRILNPDELDCDWIDAKKLKQEVEWMQHKWLGFKHDKRPKEESWSSFLDYAEIRGFEFPKISVQQQTLLRFGDSIQEARGKPPEDSPFVCMMQSWLTLGMLEALFQRTVKVNYLTRVRTEGDVVVDTRNLTYAFYAEMKKAESLPTEQRQRLAVHYNEVLLEHQGVVLYLKEGIKDLVRDCETSFERPQSSAIALQNAVLISAMIEEAFVNALRRVCPGVTLHIILTDSDPLLALARALLEQNGMCPYVVRYVEPQSYSLMFWLVWFATVTGFYRSEDHGLCCRNHCALDELKYTGFLHEESCVDSACAAVTPDSGEVCRSLELGNVPLLRLQHCESRFKIETISCQPATLKERGFVAFSHVWRHGRGSTTEQGFLQCQIGFIWDVIRRLKVIADGCADDSTTSELFWIDSLCIPSSKHHRRLAIQNINKVFSAAKGVLVLDKSLATLKNKDHEDDVLWAAIATSAWQTRLWTFVEAFVAPWLGVVFDDYIYPLRAYDGVFRRDPSVPKHMDLVNFELWQLYQVAQCEALADSKAGPRGEHALEGIFSFLQAIRGRSTTKATDEAYILAIALGDDVKKLSSAVNGDDRMAALYGSMRQVPTWFLFLGQPPLPNYPYRWSPRSLLLKNEQMLDSPGPETFSDVTSEGLSTNLPTIFFRQPHIALSGRQSREVFILSNKKGIVLHGALQPFWSDIDVFESTTWDAASRVDMLVINEDLQTRIRGDILHGLLCCSQRPLTTKPDPQEPVTCKTTQSVRVEINGPRSIQSFPAETWVGLYHAKQRLLFT